MKNPLGLTLFSGILLLGFITAFWAAGSMRMPTYNPDEMNPILPAQEYEAEWRKVDSLIQKYLVKDAQEIVDRIYLQASTEGNEPQVLKAVLYTLQIRQMSDEESVFKNYDRMVEEIAKAKSPLKQMLQSLLAEHYSSYYLNNSWRFADRTDGGEETNDPRTWSSQRIIEEARKNYLASLVGMEELLKVNVREYAPVLQKATGSETIRPTLFDLLAHRVLGFLQAEAFAPVQTPESFILEGNNAFASPEAFMAADFSTKDSLSPVWMGIKLWQTLSEVHASNPRTAFFVEIQRLEYAKSQSVDPQKNEYYFQALERLQKRYPTGEEGAEVAYRLAGYWIGQAAENEGQENHLGDRKRALDLLQPFVVGEGHAFHNCRALVEQIQQKSFGFEILSTIKPDAPSMIHANYRNANEVFFKIVKFDIDKDLEYNVYQEEFRKDLRARPALKSWSVKLPSFQDMNPHRVDLPLPAMPKGNYALLASEQGGFSDKGAVLFVGRFDVSNLAYVARQAESNLHEVTVMDRETGLTLKGVRVQVVQQEYDYKKSRYVREYKEISTSDDNGKCLIRTSGKNHRSFYLKFMHEGHEIVSWDQWYQNNPYANQAEPREIRTVFFTDRAIYRPGQTVYFKGIVLERIGNKTSIRPGFESTVAFHDVNGQEVSSQSLTSNEYGTFCGTFTAPKGQLNGQMSIEGFHGEIYFSVEDYKRPKFEVVLDPVKGSFRLGDKVTVKGKAVAYAGSAIDGAQVQYRVVRSASYPYCDWGWWRPRPSSPEMEIAHGVTTTGSEGQFDIAFEAVPDRKVDPESKPQFSYRIYVDVVDITGETQGTEGSVNVGFVALDAGIEAATEMQKGKNQFLRIRSRNLNGEFEAATGSIKVVQLSMPKNPLHSRKASVPDQFVIAPREFQETFPHEAMKDEDNPSQWAASQTVLDKVFDTKKSDSLPLGEISKWQEGMYRAVLETKDVFGTPLKVVHHFWVYSPESKTRSIGGFLQFAFPEPVVEPGKDAEIVVSSSEEGIRLRVEVEKKGEIVSTEWKTLQMGTQTLKFPVKEADRGNFAVHLMAVRKGELFAETKTVVVPWTNMHLKMEFSTFRSKLWPGQAEEWVMKVKGAAGEKIAAEMLAGMYDASLDAFTQSDWGLYLNPSYYPQRGTHGNNSWNLHSAQAHSDAWAVRLYTESRQFDQIKSIYVPTEYRYRIEKSYSMRNEMAEGDDFGGKPPAPAAMEAPADAVTEEKIPEKEADGKDKSSGESGPKVRTNLNETAFFFPHLRTDEKGDVLISFTIPEALTRWKFRALAHTKDLKVGYAEKLVVTQKELMVMPNPPRFFRENDKVQFTSKISNMSEGDMKGEAKLMLFDAMTMQPVDAQFGNQASTQSFQAKKGQSAVVKWALRVPVGIDAVVFRVVAQSGTFSDGEEGALPVLSNSMLVTESMPLPVRPNETKSFIMEKMVENKSTTLRHHRFTLEFTSNPAWYAVQALPYMMEFPYECTEQTFSRFYANSLASHIANSHPRIKQVFDQWASAPDSKALVSNLEKNQELKSLLLEETPWVMDAGNESERKKRIALLFDLNRMANEQDAAIKKVRKAQVSNGAWPWFPGMPESRFITQHVVAGMGHLDKLGVKSVMEDGENVEMIKSAARYLDGRLAADLQWLKDNKVKLDQENLGYDQVHLMYARSFFPQFEVANKATEAYAYYIAQIKKYWPSHGRYTQAMMSLVLHRSGAKEDAKSILKGLKQIATLSPEMGMYWKDIVSGWYWYQAPIETQALLIEAFHEVTADAVAVEEMKIWLLKQKQTQDWKTTKATAEACYALLLTGKDFLASTQLAQITVGNIQVDPANRPDIKVEAGTGYFKTNWSASEIRPEMGKVKVSNPNAVPAWGAVYWQYFEQLEKITLAQTNISIGKELFRKENTDRGPKLTPLKPGEAFKVGDLVQVRMVIRTDRDMEFVHIKDMRGSGFEPVDVLSRYKWQDGLGYYQSTRDAATNFFIDYLRKGTYVFEYSLRATHEGDFSNGITTIQCMYAPEFTAHSKGIRVQIGQ